MLRYVSQRLLADIFPLVHDSNTYALSILSGVCGYFEYELCITIEQNVMGRPGKRYPFHGCLSWGVHVIIDIVGQVPDSVSLFQNRRGWNLTG